MQPVDFKERNVLLQPPPGLQNCIPLPVYNNREFSLSAWQLSDEEIIEINRTGKIYLAVYWGESQPPVWLSASKPLLPPVPGLPFSGPDEEEPGERGN